MAERLDLPDDFPSAKELEDWTLKAVKENPGTISTDEIRNYIVNNLKPSDEVLEFENTDGLSSLFDYRLRWARTSLKNQGKIKCVKRGYWTLA